MQKRVGELLDELDEKATNEGGFKKYAKAGSDRSMLVSQLEGSVIDLCMSPHGHQVLASVVETMPVSALGFVAAEMEGRGAMTARHRFGSRVLEVMIMHCLEAQMTELAKEIVFETVELSRDPHGNRVIQHLLEHGTGECRSEIIRRLQPDMPSLAADRTATRVVAKAFDFSNEQEQRLLAMSFLQPSSRVADVACSRCGSSVLAQIANLGYCRAEFRVKLARDSRRLTPSKFGRRVLHSFDLPVGSS